MLAVDPYKCFLRQYRIILSAAAAGAVLKPQGGNCAVLPKVCDNLFAFLPGAMRASRPTDILSVPHIPQNISNS